MVPPSSQPPNVHVFVMSLSLLIGGTWNLLLPIQLGKGDRMSVLRSCYIRV